MAILKDLEKRAEAQSNVGKKSRLWDERFYLLLILALPFILWWFRRGYIFFILFTFFIPRPGLEATSIQDYFKNSEERGKTSLDEGDYETAISSFKDPYRKGIAHYKLGDFAGAEKLFLESSREEVSSSAMYNLGNALAYQQKFKEAVKAYEQVLEKWPDHVKAKDNLELVKNILDEQKGKGEDSSSEDPGDDRKEGDDQKEKGSSKSDGSDKEEGEKVDPDESGDKSKEEDFAGDSEEKDQQEGQEAKEQDSAGEVQKNEGEEEEGVDEEEGAPPKAQTCKSQEDLDADLWLNQISNDPKAFLKNKFYIESKKNGATKGTDPW